MNFSSKSPGARGITKSTKPLAAQAKLTGVLQPKNRPVAPPVYRPESILPKVLQTKKTASKPAGQKQPEYKAPAALAGRIQKTAKVAQLHPLAIKIEGYQEWKRDTGVIDLPSDINLFHAKIRPDNPAIVSIKVKRKNIGDHQVVVVGIAGGTFMQMDMSDSGTMLRYPADENHYSVTVGIFNPKPGLKLDDVFRAFFKATRKKGYDFEEYNCIRFANDLAGRIGTVPVAKVAKASAARHEDDSGGRDAPADWDMDAFK